MSKRKKSRGGTAVAPFDRRLMEKMMRDINAFVAERQPRSIDEANALHPHRPP